MRKKIGTYPLGYEWVDLFIEDIWGASFRLIPDNKSLNMITVGIKHENDYDILTNLIHETFEFALTQKKCQICFCDKSQQGFWWVCVYVQPRRLL